MVEVFEWILNIVSGLAILVVVMFTIAFIAHCWNDNNDNNNNNNLSF